MNKEQIVEKLTEIKSIKEKLRLTYDYVIEKQLASRNDATESIFKIINHEFGIDFSRFIDSYHYTIEEILTKEADRDIVVLLCAAIEGDSVNSVVGVPGWVRDLQGIIDDITKALMEEYDEAVDYEILRELAEMIDLKDLSYYTATITGY